MQLVKLIIFAFFLQVQGVHSQEDLNHKKISPLIEISAESPLRLPNNFYNKNNITSHYFRAGYGVGIQYRFNNKWAIKGVLTYYQRFIEQRFYFGGFGDDADFYYNHRLAETGLKLESLRSLSITKNSTLFWNFGAEPWLNISQNVKSSERRIPDGLGGFRDSWVDIDPSKQLQFAFSTGLTYEYFRDKCSFGFDLDLRLRGGKQTNYELVVTDWFRYAGAYSIASPMLSITGFVSF